MTMMEIFEYYLCRFNNICIRTCVTQGLHWGAKAKLLDKAES